MPSLQPYPLSCSYASLCGGCDFLLKPYDQHKELKCLDLRTNWSRHLSSELPEIRWVTIANGGLRDRVDFMIDQRSGVYKLGLFDRFRTGLVDIQGCPQLSPALEDWFTDFRRYRLRVERGSVRLRIAPDGTRGVWLDFANIDVKNLLDERKTLDRIRDGAVIEIGQRRKRLVERDGKLKLDDPVLYPWFETYTDEKAVPLYCSIGTFTQPGFCANRALIDEVRRQLGIQKVGTTLEFGAGIGNFTMPLASASERVQVFEIDALALEGLKLSAEKAGLSEKIEIHQGNFQAARPVDFKSADLLFVDPPRSGLQQFLDPLVTLGGGPSAILYVSCFAESFAKDAARLITSGYRLIEIAIVDQFPQSRHYEIVARFGR